MKNQTACFTGHRHIDSNELETVSQRLENVLIELIKKGYRYFGSGGALGFDLLAAQAVLNLREKYPQIKLILVLPCADQTKFWNQNEIRIYEEIKGQANKTVCLSAKYSSGCMHKRNRHLVDNSSVCISYLRKQSGGTYYTVEYAKAQNVRIINL